MCSFSLFPFTILLITIKILFFTHNLEGTSYITLWIYIPFIRYKFTVLRKCLLVFLPDYLSMRREVYSRILWNPLHFFFPSRNSSFKFSSLPLSNSHPKYKFSQPSYIIRNIISAGGKRGNIRWVWRPWEATLV